MWLRSKCSYTDKEIGTIIKALIDYYNNLFPFSDTETDVKNLLIKLCKEIDKEFPVEKIHEFTYINSLNKVAKSL